MAVRDPVLVVLPLLVEVGDVVGDLLPLRVGLPLRVAVAVPVRLRLDVGLLETGLGPMLGEPDREGEALAGGLTDGVPPGVRLPLTLTLGVSLSEALPVVVLLADREDVGEPLSDGEVEREGVADRDADADAEEEGEDDAVPLRVWLRVLGGERDPLSEGAPLELARAVPVGVPVWSGVPLMEIVGVGRGVLDPVDAPEEDAELVAVGGLVGVGSALCVPVAAAVGEAAALDVAAAVREAAGVGVDVDTAVPVAAAVRVAGEVAVEVGLLVRVLENVADGSAVGDCVGVPLALPLLLLASEGDVENAGLRDVLTVAADEGEVVPVAEDAVEPDGVAEGITVDVAKIDLEAVDVEVGETVTAAEGVLEVVPLTVGVELLLVLLAVEGLTLGVAGHATAPTGAGDTVGITATSPAPSSQYALHRCAAVSPPAGMGMEATMRVAPHAAGGPPVQGAVATIMRVAGPVPPPPTLVEGARTHPDTVAAPAGPPPAETSVTYDAIRVAPLTEKKALPFEGLLPVSVTTGTVAEGDVPAGAVR